MPDQELRIMERSTKTGQDDLYVTPKESPACPHPWSLVASSSLIWMVNASSWMCPSLGNHTNTLSSPTSTSMPLHSPLLFVEYSSPISLTSAESPEESNKSMMKLSSRLQMSEVKGNNQQCSTVEPASKKVRIPAFDTVREYHWSSSGFSNSQEKHHLRGPPQDYRGPRGASRHVTAWREALEPAAWGGNQVEGGEVQSQQSRGGFPTISHSRGCRRCPPSSLLVGTRGELYRVSVSHRVTPGLVECGPASEFTPHRRGGLTEVEIKTKENH
ncbi:hypothetical protein RRG08_033906 [Elysia crispata]|uniref:Uncharacterized protein n=1 Tax=Elysia crispata TaxID=231223 RepID=A0AAE1ECA9_9GAST|nr:hypothetical protein RRG08_033906 [Elysia crispata]